MRLGLCIDDKTKSTVKRGWPKIYECTDSNAFNHTLKRFVNELFLQKKLVLVNIDSLNIVSENYITIAYIKSLLSWIISLKGNQTVVVQSMEGLDELKNKG